GASAWHYWQFVNGNPRDGEGLLLRNGDLANPPKRLYTVGNFSKFVRPGYARVETSGSLPDGIWAIGFQGPDGTLVVVAINSTASDVPLTVSVKGTAWPSQVTPWVTSAADNLAAKASVAGSSGSFATTLGAQTVTTFVGTP
ncbi:MAG: hypothetical protein JOZ69_13915, partial [Myxococcales bacterium]|nr:hypothetical protein [Myxococcales bacterium]